MSGVLELLKWRTRYQNKVKFAAKFHLDRLIGVHVRPKNFRGRKVLSNVRKSSLGGATIGPRMPEKNLKVWENGCKVCDNHFAHLEMNWKKNSTMIFLPHVLYRSASV